MVFLMLIQTVPLSPPSEYTEDNVKSSHTSELSDIILNSFGLSSFYFPRLSNSLSIRI